MRLNHFAVIASLAIVGVGCAAEGGSTPSTPTDPSTPNTVVGPGSTVAPTTTPGTTPTTAPATTTTTTSTTTTTTSTTAAPLPTLTYTGVADKAAGCYSAFSSKITFAQQLGTDGWWDFRFQGCTAAATETVALDDPAGGPTGDAFQAPTGYKCKFEIVGTSDSTAYFTNKVGSAADTGGIIFLQSSSAWSSNTTWKITCIQA